MLAIKIFIVIYIYLGITKTEKIELKHKIDEQISPVNGLEP